MLMMFFEMLFALFFTGLTLWMWSMQLVHLIREGSGELAMLMLSLLLSSFAGGAVLIIVQAAKDTVKP